MIEILVLQAVAHQARGDRPAALASLQRALTLAEPEGYVRVFADEGPALAALLKAAAKQGTAPGYVRRLLAAVNTTGPAAPVQPGLIEPLSDRELDVLRLLGTDLSGPDIARQLSVSLSTVRTHTNRIYAKLGVNNRRAAVRRAPSSTCCRGPPTANRRRRSPTTRRHLRPRRVDVWLTRAAASRGPSPC